MNGKGMKQLQHCDYGDIVFLHGNLYIVGHKVPYKNMRLLTYYDGKTHEESMNTTVTVEYDADATLWTAYEATKQEQLFPQG